MTTTATCRGGSHDTTPGLRSVAIRDHHGSSPGIFFWSCFLMDHATTPLTIHPRFPGGLHATYLAPTWTSPDGPSTELAGIIHLLQKRVALCNAVMAAIKLLQGTMMEPDSEGRMPTNLKKLSVAIKNTIILVRDSPIEDDVSSKAHAMLEEASVLYCIIMNEIRRARDGTETPLSVFAAALKGIQKASDFNIIASPPQSDAAAPRARFHLGTDDAVSSVMWSGRTGDPRDLLRDSFFEADAGLD